MFDKTFYRFALGFAAIIAVSLAALYVAQYVAAGTPSTEAASSR